MLVPGQGNQIWTLAQAISQVEFKILQISGCKIQHSEKGKGYIKAKKKEVEHAVATFLRISHASKDLPETQQEAFFKKLKVLLHKCRSKKS